jgi:hypothetical protein
MDPAARPVGTQLPPDRVFFARTLRSILSAPSSARMTGPADEHQRRLAAVPAGSVTGVQAVKVR